MLESTTCGPRESQRIVPMNPQLIPIGFALTATFAWGFSDFIGGYASRQANPLLLTTITHVSGTLLMLTLALVLHSSFPEKQSLSWAMAAGVAGGTALALFYRALSVGNMGLAAPVAAVLGAAIPTIVDLLIEGVPGRLRMVGYVLAVVGIWFISRAEDQAERPKEIGLAALAGIGFAGYFLCIRQAGSGSVFWIAAFGRAAALVTSGVLVLASRQFRPMTGTGVAWGLLGGILDVTGTAFFILASQTGRLDAAVVISSLYPAITVLLASIFLSEQFSRWRVVGLLAALLAVPMIAV